MHLMHIFQRPLQPPAPHVCRSSCVTCRRRQLNSSSLPFCRARLYLPVFRCLEPRVCLAWSLLDGGLVCLYSRRFYAVSRLEWPPRRLSSSIARACICWLARAPSHFTHLIFSSHSRPASNAVPAHLICTSRSLRPHMPACVSVLCRYSRPIMQHVMTPHVSHGCFFPLHTEVKR